MPKFRLLNILLSLLSLSVAAQENSPYSRYGIGLLQARENIANRGMGGAAIADRSNQLINPINPASYSALRLTSFQLGLNGSLFTIKSNTAQNQTGGFGLSYVNMAFPISKSGALSFGLLPYSLVNYRMRKSDSIPGISRVLYDYLGSGGIQKVYLGAAQEYKGFSLGFNLAYLFGSYQNNLAESFTDSLNIFNTNVVRRTRLNGFTWDVGASYTYTFKDEYYANVGLTFSNGATLNGLQDQYWYAAIGDVTTGPYFYAADSMIEEVGRVNLPSQLGAGIQIGNGAHWKFGIDYQMTDWSQYRFYNKVDSFTSSSALRLGGEFTPDVNDKFNAYKRISYRLGAYLTNEPLRLNGTQLSAQGVTVGIGYPIRRTLYSIGQLNTALEMGKRGTLDNGLIQENYTRFSIGVTLNDRWFLKRKYD